MRNNEVIIPKGNDVILPGDRLIVITLPQTSKVVEKFFEEK